MNWTNCCSSHIERNNLRGKKRRKFTARNASLCRSLYVWENHKYFNNKVQVSMRTWKNKTGLGNTIKRNFANAIFIILLIRNILRCFDRDFRRPYRYFSLVLKKRFYPCLIAMKFSSLTDFGLNSRDKLFNKKVLNDSN